MEIQGHEINVGDYLITEFCLPENPDRVQRREGFVSEVYYDPYSKSNRADYGAYFIDKRLTTKIIKVCTKEENPEYFL